MKPFMRRSLYILLGAMAFALALSPLPRRTSAQLQPASPSGMVAFLGVDPTGQATVFLLDIASGRVAPIDSPATSDTELRWQPGGEMLAFTAGDGTYTLLRSVRGCFDAAGMCSDLLEVVPPFMVSDLAWLPDGEKLVLQTDEGLRVSPPRLRPNTVETLELDCPAGIAVAGQEETLFCLETSRKNKKPTIYELADASTPQDRFELGLFSDITAFDIGPEGQVIIGTVESAGVSGFYASPDGQTARLANYQIFVYDAEIAPDGSLVALVGATADATGDNTLQDGDPAELFLYDPASAMLQQIPGFTGATALTWSPDSTMILVADDMQQFKLFYPTNRQVAPVSASSPAGIVISKLAWTAVESPLPILPATTSGASPTATLLSLPTLSTPIPTPTPNLPPTPYPTFTPFPTFTPYPTWTPYPTATPFPSATPGSPIGVGCQYAYVGTSGQPIAIGDIAEVTPYGAAVRFRTGAALDAPMIRELTPGTRMTILAGPFCSQGYRWWQAKLEADGRVGYLADSDPRGYWIQPVATAPPPPSISFYADPPIILQGNCSTIRWDVEGIKEVYFAGEGVTGHETRLVCPPQSTTYLLRVVHLDDTIEEFIVEVTVAQP